eukprot:CCRYP_018798-RA/>CCRYP_018798-RA protein AED:0.45 eAED:0.45 QI:0/-1/0/1/-1/0/1/0/94
MLEQHEKAAAEVAPVIIRIMASTLVPSILQSDNGGEFLGETVRVVNRYALFVASYHCIPFLTTSPFISCSYFPWCHVIKGRARHPQSQGGVGAE